MAKTAAPPKNAPARSTERATAASRRQESLAVLASRAWGIGELPALDRVAGAPLDVLQTLGHLHPLERLRELESVDDTGTSLLAPLTLGKDGWAMLPLVTPLVPFAIPSAHAVWALDSSTGVVHLVDTARWKSLGVAARDVDALFTALGVAPRSLEDRRAMARPLRGAVIARGPFRRLASMVTPSTRLLRAEALIDEQLDATRALVLAMLPGSSQKRPKLRAPPSPRREAPVTALLRATLAGDDAAIAATSREILRRKAVVPKTLVHILAQRGRDSSATSLESDRAAKPEPRPRARLRRAPPEGAASLGERAWEALESGADLAPIAERMSEHPELAIACSVVAQLSADRSSPAVGSDGDDRDESLYALAEHGHGAILPLLVAHARAGDTRALAMMGALGDRGAIPHLLALLSRRDDRFRDFAAEIVRALADLDATSLRPMLREMLRANPMRSWREGLERTGLVRELIRAVGKLRDVDAIGDLLAVVDSQSMEYRPLVPLTARVLGVLGAHHALPSLLAIARSPKEKVTSDLVWAIGELGRVAPTGIAEDARAWLARPSTDAGVEVVRLAAIAKLGGSPGAFGDVFHRVLWEPGFRRDETSARRVWALSSLSEVGGVEITPATIRYLVTLDDHRVRRAAERYLPLVGFSLPETRRYYRASIPTLERSGGLAALHTALADPIGVFRANVAARLGEIRSPASVRPLADAFERLLSEPSLSAFEYDDAPLHITRFVRALAAFNAPATNRALLDGLKSDNHHVRAVVADNLPADDRFVPELVRMLDDPRSFLRSRAERALRAFRHTPAYSAAMESRVRLVASAPPR